MKSQLLLLVGNTPAIRRQRRPADSCFRILAEISTIESKLTGSTTCEATTCRCFTMNHVSQSMNPRFIHGQDCHVWGKEERDLCASQRHRRHGKRARARDPRCGQYRSVRLAELMVLLSAWCITKRLCTSIGTLRGCQIFVSTSTKGLLLVSCVIAGQDIVTWAVSRYTVALHLHPVHRP
jgi:hypothetical protein